MAKNELLPFADGENANVLPTNQWEALTDILENGFQSGVARSEQVNRVLAQGAVASYVLGQLIVEELNQDATLDKDTLYQRLVSALESKAKDVCLPLSGGTLSGPLKFSNDYISRTTKNNNLNISGGNSWRDGGYFEAYGPQINDGMVMLVANNGTTSKHLKVTISGLTYDGNNVITSAGGTMTGTLDAPYIFAKKSTDNAELNIYGSTTDNHGGRLTLYGQDCQWTPGGFNLIASNASKGQWWALSGETNGSLTWGGKKVVCVESWTSGASGYRKYSDGFIEQWGKTSASGRVTTTVTLHTAMSNTNYNVTISQAGASDTWSTYATINSTTQFTLTNNYGPGSWWRVCGY